MIFSRPTSISDFFIKSLKTLPYVAVFNGIIFSLIGAYMVYSASSFSSRGTAANLTVITVESRRSDNGTVYRPLFEAVRSDGSTLQYSGNTWVSPKPHSEGDRVAGLVDWESGEIRSISMLESSKSFGTTFASIGLISFLLGSLYIWWKRRKTS